MNVGITKDRAFWNKIADTYARQPVSDEEKYQKKLTLTQGFLERDMRVLEFGCGTGSTALLHAPYVAHILAVDLAENMLAHGREKARNAGIENVTFRQSGIEELEVESAGFDAVLGLNILHLCRDPLAVMQKVSRLLKPGGLFIQSTACVKDFPWTVRLALPVMQAIGKAPYLSRFSEDELLAMIDAAAFHIIEHMEAGSMEAEFIISRKGLS